MTLKDDVDSPLGVLGPEEGDILGDPDAVSDRFMIEGGVTGGRFCVGSLSSALRSLSESIVLADRPF